ncbi:MAG: hypothetical protein KGL13_05850, partial [Gammaproteobacteria bacterium]|nr:hypothetical protein [Gammaproteobacteria bacterium]
IAYFQARRVGDSVARVRELENIRNFITSSSLTLVIDLIFTFVFIGVMAVYSPLLTWIALASFPLYIGISILATPIFRTRLAEKFERGAEPMAGYHHQDVAYGCRDVFQLRLNDQIVRETDAWQERTVFTLRDQRHQFSLVH